MAEAAAESGVSTYGGENLSAAQALGLMWDASPPPPPQAVAYSPESMAQLTFDGPAAAAAPTEHFMVHHPQPPPIPPQMPVPATPMPPLHTPAVAPDNSDVNKLLAIAMSGPLAGLSNMQIENQLRSAAAQIEVYDD